jgi:hypothetical protein
MEERVLHYLEPHLENGTAVWVAEYGGMSDATGFAEYIGDLHSIYASHNVSSALWDYYRGDGGFALLDAAGALKPVFAEVFGTPAPTLLPTPPVQTPDWDHRAITLDFDCVVGRSVTMLLPADGCACAATPADGLEPLGDAAGFVSGACLRDTALSLDCGCAPP